MSDQKLSIVTYFFRGAPRTMGLGYLLERDGQSWCFPNEDLAKAEAFPSGGFQLDLSLLLEQHDTGADRKLYLYRGEVEKTPQGPKTIPRQSGDMPNQVWNP